ncbi:hypothetical protein CMV_011314 [Castanea mollissima]|uniref:DUF1517 domain-containing protein n=1 Tax=Castanea mollissima TaxID=60419 RepID=A0A8J4RD87_9ROSI|nr:hypothetical protein CMV_011314 [Castanea mollissima]
MHLFPLLSQFYPDPRTGQELGTGPRVGRMFPVDNLHLPPVAPVSVAAAAAASSFDALKIFLQVVRRWSLKAVEKEFRQLSTDERVKYDIESLVNVDNVKVTILVAVKGALNIPEIKSTEDLRTALHYLNTITSNNTLAVEVLWSPQAEHDTLSEDELLENYPLLRPI